LDKPALFLVLAIKANFKLNEMGQ
jgi:hypothetical protein